MKLSIFNISLIIKASKLHGLFRKAILQDNDKQLIFNIRLQLLSLTRHRH